jgi:voltage-gated potassium channel Kch
VLARWLAERRTRRRPIVLVGTDVTPAIARRHRFRVVAGDPMDWATLVAAGVYNAARVFALSDTSAVNARVALTLQRLRGTISNSGRAWPTMAVYARADDARLVAALRAHGLAAEDPRDGYTLDFFSIEERAAAKLLEADDDPDRSVAVIGDDRFAAAVVDELRRLRRHAGTTPAILVRPTAADDPVPEGTATIYVCATDPDDVLRIGLELLLDGHRDVVLCLGRRALLADALEGPLFEGVDGRLTVFGILDAACRPEDLAQSALVEQLAQALHAYYLREHGADGTRPSQVPWTRLAPNFRADNRAQAEHIGTKLRTIDAVVVPAAPGLPPFAFRDDDEVEKLAKMEHERWMRAKEAEHVTGRQVGPIAHADYRGWDDGLSAEAKDKDRGFVRNLPALLAEEGLAIVRRPRTGA